jgi:hypothetical protein
MHVIPGTQVGGLTHSERLALERKTLQDPIQKLTKPKKNMGCVSTVREPATRLASVGHYVQLPVQAKTQKNRKRNRK